MHENEKGGLTLTWVEDWLLPTLVVVLLLLLLLLVLVVDDFNGVVLGERLIALLLVLLFEDPNRLVLLLLEEKLTFPGETDLLFSLMRERWKDEKIRSAKKQLQKTI